MKRALAVFAVLAVLGIGCAGGCAPDYAGEAMGSLLARAPGHAEQAVHDVCPDGDTTFGIDVSYYQDAIDWSAVAAGGVQFAFIRVSDGTGFYDPKYDDNWAGAKAAGVARGTYQFFRSDEDPIAQADLLLSHMGALEPGDLPPVADVETADGVDNATRVQKLHQWLDHVEAAVGVKPIIYTGGYFWQDNVGADFSAYPLWHAGYTGGTCPSTVADQWPGWAFWQYTDNQPVDGIPAGGVDGDLYNGTLDQLKARLSTSPVCGDGFCGAGEDHDGCPGDCPICEPLPAAGGEISEQGPCFVGGGPQQFMRHVSDAGADGDLIWTHTTADAAEANFGTWTIPLTEHGRYRVEAYTDAAYAQSTQAGYVLHHGDADDVHVVDQTAADGWNVVADDVELDPADGVTLHLADNTGEDIAGNVQLVFDAIQLTRLDLPAEGEGSPGEGEGEAGPASVKEVVLLPPPEAAGGCAASGSSTSAAVAALGLLLLAVRRRRGR